MSQIKTAISVDQGIFRMIDLLAKKIHVSRSHIFETAAKEWVRKETAKDLTVKINRSLEKDRLSAEDRLRADRMRHHQRKLIEGQW